MNWKNVLSLMQVDRKSGRLIRGQKVTRYHENRFLAYWPYWVALAIGVAVGLLARLAYNSFAATDPSSVGSFRDGALSVFASLPTLVVIYSFIFTLLQQVQRSGVRAASQVPYWLPVTWQEHTLASILASLFGLPLASVVLIAAALVVFSPFIGLVVPAVAASLAVFAAAFMASATTEVFRILQVRFIGAVYKSTGRAAVWVRFVGSLLLFLVFYIIYFYVIYGAGAVNFIQTVASVQSAAWFVPFVWLGLALLYSFTSGELLVGLVFMVVSILFIVGLFLLATSLNRRFGLYEPPAITVSRGVYAPKTGMLGRLGFSSTEAALIRKDLKAFTRRRELMTIFIFPIIIILVPLIQTLGTTGQAPPIEASAYLTAFTFLFPAAIMAIMLGNFMIGEEGQAVWRIYASPISARSLVKSKYFFIVLFSLIILAITGAVGTIIYQPSLRSIIISSLEGVFIVFALGALSLSNGIGGADFTETPRPRMIRQSTSLINLIACLVAGVAILAPFIPYMLSSTLSTFMPSLSIPVFLDPYTATAISAVIAIVLTVIFYRVSLNSARELLRKAEI
ncbi:MAG: ABC-2 transporter permease [Candidatus Bathyarchaeota archaeon]|nr:ABC-2 transporter permease [Candidatus Bathyarchaeota archaeon]